MFEPYFFHNTLLKHVAVFGSLFNNIHVVRRGKSNNILNQEKVPIAHGARRKFLARLDEREDLDDVQLAIKLPRMSFEIQSLQYDATRQKNRYCFDTLPATDNDPNKKATFYHGAPYILTFELNIMARTHNDANQILEQILPTFQPSYGVSIKPIDGQSTIKEDLKYILTSVNISDDYEGAFIEKEILIYTLTFDVKILMYGGISDSEIIKTAITNFYLADKPNDLLSTITHAVTPQSATEDDTFTINVSETFGYE